ncbi:MAG: tRNA 2-thiouridine(34) synthase MnmA [Treponema sp.]|jgi:tRNA-specific 2-thiouridylase|nr:tRNA 2-thiouridine(34) synthase MnmA [Treponema sp.]
MENKAVIAMSGGVDSSVAAALMLEQGYDCTGITLRLHKDKSDCSALRDIDDAQAIASGLGIPHQILDFSAEFDKQVIRRFIETYEQGATPNPCIDCNRCIKFNLSMLQAYQLNFDCLATGHYARVEKDSVSGRFLLRKAVDLKKDQSYVLYCLTQQQLERARFPLGTLSKQQVRKIAEDKKLTNSAKSESQDICFVPGGDYGNFIEAYTGRVWPPGDIIDLEGKILGRHRGIIRYTIGQRRGLGVAANSPIYVADKSVANNTVTLGPDSSLYKNGLTAKNINLIACTRIDKPLRVTVKTRYLQAEQAAVAEQSGEDELYIEFDSPQRAITPGQAAVLYDGDIVVGGGTIV